MPSETDYIARLAYILTVSYRWTGPSLMALGTISSLLNLIVFIRIYRRKTTCAIYYIAVNIANLLMVYTSLLPATLKNAFDIDPALYCRSVCRLRLYAVFLFNVLTPSYLILASIDRVLFTSPNARNRQRSNARQAFTSIVSVTVFWLVCHSHALIFSDIFQHAPGYFVCYMQFGIHLLLASYDSAVVRGTLIPLSMLLLGLWTVRNIRRTGRVAPLVAAPTKTHAGHLKDRQLIRIVLTDIGVYIIFTLMTSVVLMYQQITQYQPKNPAQSHLENFLVSIGVLSSYVPFCISCFTNVLVSKNFRREVSNVFACGGR